MVIAKAEPTMIDVHAQHVEVAEVALEKQDGSGNEEVCLLSPDASGMPEWWTRLALVGLWVGVPCNSRVACFVVHTVVSVWFNKAPPARRISVSVEST